MRQTVANATTNSVPSGPDGGFTPAADGVSSHVVKPLAAPVRIAVVGCGAVAQTNLIPVLAGHQSVRLVGLIDTDRRRAAGVAQAYGVTQSVESFDSLTRETVDAVVLATPPAHHAPGAFALIERGLHLFVEKPMALNAAEAQQMTRAAQAAATTLVVGLYRRLLPSVQLLKDLVDRGEYGRPLGVDIEEGGPYGWPLATLDVLTRAKGGGGVLIDLGSHVIDILHAVVPGVMRVAEYTDDSRGGVETDCIVRLSIERGTARVPCRIELSRTRQLRNTIQIRCERATLELERGDFVSVRVRRVDADTRAALEQLPATRYQVPGDGERIRVAARWSNVEAHNGYQAFRAQFDDWVEALVAGTPPSLSGASVLPVVQLIDDCYRVRRPMAEPWTDQAPPGPSIHTVSSTTRESASSTAPRTGRVLVTGAGGFLGCRTIEILREQYGYDVRALVRTPASAARLARWPIQIVTGDVRSAADMRRAAEGCTALVHCAVGTSWKPAEVFEVTVNGTRTVAEAAREAGVKRFVHISSMAVHGQTDASHLDEDSPLSPQPEDRYGSAKLAAEREIGRAARRGLAAIILRPTRIYGPFSKTFTVRPLQAMAEGRLALAGDPAAPANMVYVDNVVHAIARAIDASDSACNRAYFVNDAEQFSLHDFFQFFGDAFGRSVRIGAPMPGASVTPKGWLPALVTAPARTIAGVRAIAFSPELRALVRRVMETDPVGRMPRRLWEMSPGLQRRLLRAFHVDSAVVYRPVPPSVEPDLVYWVDGALVRTDRIRVELGYEPVVSRSRAMELTLEWARHARLMEGRAHA